MPKIIFKCRYLKNGAHAANLVEYMATREGVEKLPQRVRNRPATEKQRGLISNLMNQFPDAADLFEYEDYKTHPTVENASEFITAVLEQNMDRLGHQDVYVKYIATRPRVEKSGAHGLFSDTDAPIILSGVADEVAHYEGNVWTPIISLRREDAARLGYDHAAAWMDLLRGKRNLFAEQMKISPENLRWYAAFHNEGHHPHCHMVVYSTDPREGYVTKPAIDKMRSAMAREIFKQDLMQIYPEQTVMRQKTAQQSRAVLNELIAQMESGTCESKAIENLLVQLAERLQHTSGKKQYGYLKSDVKALVNRIVDELARDGRVAQAYQAWYTLRSEVLHTYADKLPNPLPLSRQKEFKSIRNMVITEALRIGVQTVTLEGDEDMDEQAVTDGEFSAEQAESPAASIEDESEFIDGVQEDAQPISDIAPGESANPERTGEPAGAANPYIQWSARYLQARESLYGKENTEPDFAQALQLFQEEAAAGNVLVMCDLGRMYKDGLGIEADAELSSSWYEKAFAGFYKIESRKAHCYVEYRIGEMYAQGLGTGQDYEEAAGWLDKSAAENYKYAQYSLAGQYVRGQGVEKNLHTAFQLYEKAARQHFPYASYNLAKMCRDGLGTAVDGEKSAAYFEEAFLGFLQLEKQSRDDRLLYRIGQMLFTGTGTQKDVGAAISYLERSAKLGNVYAQCLFGKLYLAVESPWNPVESPYVDPEKGLFWLSKAADAGNDGAQYQLGKLYRDGLPVAKDMDRAVHLFTLAAKQKNSFAAYALGKLYLAGTDIPKDIGSAVKWLTAAAEQDNSFAQYRLGKLYLQGEDLTKDVESAVRWLTASANQGNQYAQYALGKLYLLGRDVPRDQEKAMRWLEASARQSNPYARFLLLEHPDSAYSPSPLLAATRLLRQLGRIFREQQNWLRGGPGMELDSKLRRRLRQKKIAMGHAADEQTPSQIH